MCSQLPQFPVRVVMKGLPHREPRIVLGAEGWGSALDSCAPRETLHCKLVPLTHTRNHHLKLMVKHLQLSGTMLGEGRGHDLEAPVALSPSPHPGQTHFRAPLWLLQPPQRAVLCPSSLAGVVHVGCPPCSSPAPPNSCYLPGSWGYQRPFHLQM